jgi:two-component system, chemotaxis family, sensor kinase CheA
MSSLDQLKQTFFDECSEALQQIELGLPDIRDGSGSEDTINAVFRGVHSVKGGAGIFGFEDLVRFAHVFETVLDEMRSGKLTATEEIVDTLLQANDVLTDLISMSRSGDSIPPDFGSECRAALQQILQANSGGEEIDDSPAPADFEGIDFVPVQVNFDEPDAEEGGAAAGAREFKIVFRPKPELLKKANEPLYIIRELKKLGKLDLVAELERLPALADLEADQPYLGWTGTLHTDASREQVDEVFEFVVGDCELEINEVGAAAAAEAMPASPPADAAAWEGMVGSVVPPDVVEDLPNIEFAPSVVPSSPAPVAPSVQLTPPAPPAAAPVSAPTLAPAPAPMPAPVSMPAAAPPPVGGDLAEAPPPPARPATTKPAGAGATTTRVELEKIDRVVNMVGELVIAQAMLGQVVHGLPEDVSGRLVQVLEEVTHHTRELKDSVMSMRAQQVNAVFQRMPRLVRELAVKTAKKVKLEMAGENTEVDRSIIERLGDPLTHIIRNSVDHGIELPADRAAAGKPEEGTIRLSAEHRGGRIVIEIKDDGAGINSERVLQKARDRGLVSTDAVLNDDEINNLIFLPGFSTAEKISDISGRGVGMDVVRRNIQDVGGRISLKSDRGRGMTIQLALPLTLAVMDGMVIRVGSETYVMPMSAIVECLRPPASDIHALIGTPGMLRLRGNLVPLVQLCDLLDIGSSASGNDERVIIITDAGEGARFGIVVDELCGHQQVVVKSIEESYGSVPGIAGATILGNGRVAFILDVEKLSDIASSQNVQTGVTRFVNGESKMAVAAG